VILKISVIDWLPEENQPSVRYHTLIDLRKHTLAALGTKEEEGVV
jgi:hypothetical protein